NKKSIEAWTKYCEIEKEGKKLSDEIENGGFPDHYLEELCEALILKIGEAYDSSGHIDESLWGKFLEILSLFEKYSAKMDAIYKEELDETDRQLERNEIDWGEACEVSEQLDENQRMFNGYHRRCKMLREYLTSLSTDESRIDIIRKLSSRSWLASALIDLFGSLDKEH
ncbi:MAG: hypothetical protein PHZ25_01460, partial [Candidatus Pacebacteria bacterium]|nr:hypothetical protein [Candidatus Paceibacterota bacterium]